MSVLSIENHPISLPAPRLHWTWCKLYVIITKQSLQADNILPKASHRRVVTEYYLSLIIKNHSVAQGLLTLETSV